MEAGHAKRTDIKWSDLTSPLLMCILMGLDEAADFHAFSATCVSWHSAASYCLGDFLLKRSHRFIVLFNPHSHETRIMDIEGDCGIFKAPPLHFHGCNDLRFIGQSEGFLIAVDAETGTFLTVIALMTGQRVNFPSTNCLKAKLKYSKAFQISFALIIKAYANKQLFLVIFDSPEGTVMSAEVGDFGWTRNEEFRCVWDAIGFHGRLYVDDIDEVTELDPKTLEITKILGSLHGILMQSSQDHLLHLVGRRGDRFAHESFMALISDALEDNNTDTEEEDEVTDVLNWPVDQSIYISWQRSDRHCRASPPMSITFGVQRSTKHIDGCIHDSFWKDFSFCSTFIIVKADPDAQSFIVADFHRVQPLPPWFSLMPTYHDSDSE